MDMSPAYIAGVKEKIGSQPKVVFGKFYGVATACFTSPLTSQESLTPTKKAHRARYLEDCPKFWFSRVGLRLGGYQV